MNRAWLSILVIFLCAGLAQATLIDTNVLSTLQHEDQVRVIVTYDEHPLMMPDDIVDAPEIDTFFGTLSKSEIASLSNDPNVKAIYEDWKLEITRDDGWDIINADILNNISINGTNITGAGHTICVLDTGINYNHTEFGKCNSTEFENGSCPHMLYGYDYVNNDDDPFDDEGHGTHVTGIIKRVAPDVDYVIMKVCDGAGDCYVSDMTTATSFCNAWRDVYNITAISISIGDKAAWTDDNCFPSDPMAQMINNAHDNGIMVLVASGNEGYTTGINYPACARGATSVGATTDGDAIASFTNRYSTLDVMAPGYQINSTYLGDTYAIKSGTSMATPFVSAASVLLKQYHELNDNITLSPIQVENKLKSGGILVSSWPRIDLNRSLSAGYECFLSTDCPADVWLNDTICQEDNVYANKSEHTCDFGTCMQNISLQLKESCTGGCENGSCLQVAEEPRSSGGGGGFESNIETIEIIANNEWAIDRPTKVLVKIYDKSGNPIDADKVELVLIFNETGLETMLDVATRTDKGTYQLNITPVTGLGDYILEARVYDTYEKKTAQKPVKLVKLNAILSITGFEPAGEMGFLAKFLSWIQDWGQRWP